MIRFVKIPKDYKVSKTKEREYKIEMRNAILKTYLAKKGDVTKTSSKRGAASEKFAISDD